MGLKTSGYRVYLKFYLVNVTGCTSKPAFGEVINRFVKFTLSQDEK